MAKAGESPLHMHMVIVSYVLTVAVMLLPAAGWRTKWGAQYLLHRYRAVYRGFAVLRDGEYAGSAGDGTRSAGRWRSHDGAGRAADGDEDRPARAVYGGNDFVTLPAVGPLLGPALGGILVEYASGTGFSSSTCRWALLALSPPALMPNYTLQTRRFDVVGFLLLATGMATLTLALDGQKGWESPH